MAESHIRICVPLGHANSMHEWHLCNGHASPLPSLPLIIEYEDTTATLSAKDELGMSQALQLRDRIRHVALSISPAIFHKLILFMDDTFPTLERLCLSSTAKEEDAGLILPTTFMAPNLRHLTLLGIGFPTGLSSLTSSFALITLILADIRTSGYFLPKHLVARLRFLPQLEELSVCFSIHILPRPSAEGELLDVLEAPVTLPALRRLTFRGVSAYLESLVIQLSAPVLEQLDITIFNQVALTLPRLSYFINTTTEGLKLPVASVIFDSDAVSVVINDRAGQQRAAGPSSFTFRVRCREFDRQVGCAAQVCNALIPVLSSVEALRLELDVERPPTDWQDVAVNGASWRELLAPFVEARELHICHALVGELASVPQSDGPGLGLMVLTSLQELALHLEEGHANNAFRLFFGARRIAGRPVRSEVDLASRPRSTLRNWFRSALINPIRSRLSN
ncbi:hypothetical protein EI94DRAFT_867170 [Lactarius quietus]|nr:hypothetical protein EI94DRAFT_867170 [Lactarius quietus]